MATLNIVLDATDTNADAGYRTSGSYAATSWLDIIGHATEASRWSAALYFTQSTLDSSVTINTATMTLVISTTTYDDVHANIHCCADAAPALWSNYATLAALTKTTASDLWDATSIGSGAQQTADFTSALQEQIDAMSGTDNICAFIVATSTVRQLRFKSTNPDGENIEMDIDYTAGGAVNRPDIVGDGIGYAGGIV